MEAVIKVIKYFGADAGAYIFALYIRTAENRDTVETYLGKTVNIGVDESMSRAKPEQIQEAVKLLKEGLTPEEVAARTGCGHSTVYRLRKDFDNRKRLEERRSQLKKAKGLIEAGKSPAAAAVSTGISMTATKRMAREIKKEITPVIKAAVNPNSAPANSEVNSKLMSEKDLQQYGMPTNLQFAKVPKDLQIVIGPVGVSLAPEVMKSAIEPLKALGVENIHITIDALKEI